MAHKRVHFCIAYTGKIKIPLFYASMKRPPKDYKSSEDSLERQIEEVRSSTNFGTVCQ